MSAKQSQRPVGWSRTSENGRPAARVTASSSRSRCSNDIGSALPTATRSSSARHVDWISTDERAVERVIGNYLLGNAGDRPLIGSTLWRLEQPVSIDSSRLNLRISFEVVEKPARDSLERGSRGPRAVRRRV